MSRTIYLQTEKERLEYSAVLNKFGKKTLVEMMVRKISRDDLDDLIDTAFNAEFTEASDNFSATVRACENARDSYKDWLARMPKNADGSLDTKGMTKGAIDQWQELLATIAEMRQQMHKAYERSKKISAEYSTYVEKRKEGRNA